MKLTLIFLFITNLYSAQITWLHNYDQALKIATQEHKDIYLFIGADVCNFCDKYKQQTLSKERVLKHILKDYIPLYLSRDQHIIPKKFEKYGVPRHYFLDSKGKIYFETKGFLEVDGFFMMLDEAELSKE